MADRILKYSLLSKTMQGTDVKEAQSLLVKHGFSVTVDGKYGAKTAAAVKAFQTVHKLFIDGAVGPNTWKALRAQPFTGTAHFTREEFKCQCGGKYCNGYKADVPTGVTPALYALLERIRTEVNAQYGNGKDVGIGVRSGYRCPKHNKAVGGAAKSQHMYATAADISTTACTPYQLGVICDKLNPNGGVGLGGTNIVHVDVRPNRSRWWYTFKSWNAWKAHFTK